MIIEFKRDSGILLVEGARYPCTSIVRNELNGRRALHKKRDVVHSVPDRLPYMPRPFPLGEWKVVTIKKRAPSDPDYGYLGPYYIGTNAFQELPVWALDLDGGYDHPTTEYIIDRAYGFHYARDSLTTLGCARVASEKAMLAIVSSIRNQDVTVLVTAS